MEKKQSLIWANKILEINYEKIKTVYEFIKEEIFEVRV